MSSSEQESKAWLQNQHKENGDKACATATGFKKGGRLSRLSCLEKVLLLLFVLTFIALLILIVVVLVNKDDGKNKKAKLCNSPECVLAAAQIYQGMDTSVDPCDNLYQFACGGWESSHVIPQDKYSLDKFSLLSDKVDIVLKNLLEAKIQDSDRSYIKKAKNLYESCLDLDLVNKLGDKALRQLLAGLGGWPVTTPGWNENNFDLVNTTIAMNRLGARPIISFYASFDSKNSSHRVLAIDQSVFVLPGQKYYLVERNDTMLAALEKFIFQVASQMGLAEDEASAKQQIKEIVDFEIELARINVPDEDRRDSNTLYNPMTLHELHSNNSKVFDWNTFVHLVTDTPEIGLTDVTANETIINSAPSYFMKLSNLLENTPKRTVANYMFWYVVEGLVSTQGDAYLEVQQEYFKTLYGMTARKARYRTCVHYTTKILSLAVGQMFIKDNFDSDAKFIADDMISNLQDAFNMLLVDVPWMDDNTRDVAKEKNQFIKSRIGYPKEIKNDTYLTQLYANYSYVPTKYFDNVLNERKEAFNSNFRNLRQRVDKDKWKIAPSTVNAFYNSFVNQIMFPAGILQPPFFSKTNPKSLNYGAIGVVIGHEITHAFDDKGRQYDKDGNLVQWWSSKAIANFKKKAQCFIDQYSNFTLKSIGKHLNGINTQGENIADNGGLKQSYRAYREWVKTSGKEEDFLPGLDYTHDQLFFISFAQMWCNLMTKGRALNSIRTGVHSPGQFRVIGSAQNSVEFSEAFNCPKDSYMNRPNKCSVW